MSPVISLVTEMREGETATGESASWAGANVKVVVVVVGGAAGVVL